MKQKVILNIAISLDGYVANPNDGIDWLESYDNLGEYGFDEFISSVGAIIMGRRSYDIGIENDWFKGNPYGPSPIFVVTSKKHPKHQTDGNFTFVEGGIEKAYELASTAAGNKNIYLFGGPNVVQQFMRKNLLDEIHLSIAPVILGSGIPLFADLGERIINLERTDVKTYSDGLTSMHFKIIK
jgi:dihydrofolate reductase